MHGTVVHFKLWLSYDSVGSKIYYGYGQWLFPHTVDYHAASPTDLEHVTCWVSAELIYVDNNFQINCRFSEWYYKCSHCLMSLSECFASHAQLMTERLVSSMLFHCHHTTKCFLSGKGTISSPFSIHVGHYSVSEIDNLVNMWKFLWSLCLNSITGI